MNRRNFVKSGILSSIGASLFSLSKKDEEIMVLEFNKPTIVNRIYRKENVKSIPETIFTICKDDIDQIIYSKGVPLNKVILSAKTILKDDGIYIKNIKVLNPQQYEYHKNRKIVTGGIGNISSDFDDLNENKKVDSKKANEIVDFHLQFLFFDETRLKGE